jgi:DNA-binding MarR family transcriptional regulator
MREGPLTPSELASRLQLTPGAVTGVIKRLESTGHAHREASEGDGRSVRIAPEAASVQLATERLLPLIIDMNRRTSRFSDTEMDVIHRFLDGVAEAYRAGIAAMDDDAAPPPPVE